jgi:hypothetical protein
VSVAVNIAPRVILKYTWIFYGAPPNSALRLTYLWRTSLGCATHLRHLGACRRLSSSLPHLAASRSRTLANRAATSCSPRPARHRLRSLALASPSTSPPPLALASRSICSARLARLALRSRSIRRLRSRSICCARLARRPPGGGARPPGGGARPQEEKRDHQEEERLRSPPP